MIINDNFKLNSNKPLDSRYYNGLNYWPSINDVNTCILLQNRYIGLTVNILGNEYWYYSGITNNDLVLKKYNTIESASNGISYNTNNNNIYLGGILTGNTYFDGTNNKYTLNYCHNYSDNYTSRSLVDKEYVDSIASGIRPKQSVILATTEDITLNGLQIIDGVETNIDDRVLVKNQNNKIDNGIYNVKSDNWIRSNDFDNIIVNNEIVSGTYLFVLSGNTNINKSFVLITKDPIIIGESELIFTDFFNIVPVVNGVGILVNLYGNGYQIDLDGNNLVGNGLNWNNNKFNINDNILSINNISITGSSNGIIKYNSNNISLGGLLTGTTKLELPYNSQSYFQIGNGDINNNWYGGNLKLCRDNNNINKNSFFIGSKTDDNNYNYICDSVSTGITINSIISGVEYGIKLNNYGLNYIKSYHNIYTNRSIVDKEYVDVSISNICGNNGLNRIGNNIKLGGNLNENTCIGGNLNTSLFIGGYNNNLSCYNVETNDKIINTSNYLEFNTKCSSIFCDTSLTPKGIQYKNCYHDTYVNRSLVDKEYVDKNIINYSGTTTFKSDIVVSLKTGKSFGRYCNGDVIPANGKTASEVILMSVIEPIPPIVNLISHDNILTFGLNSKTVNLSYYYVIKSLNGIISSTKLEYNRNGNWITLDTNVNSISYIHVIDDSLDRFNSTDIVYRYTVIDNLGASASTTHNVYLNKYQIPTFNINYVGTLNSYETQNNREIGNNNTLISGNIVSNNNLIKLNSYKIKRSYNNGSFITISNEDNFSVNNKTITSYLDTSIPINSNNIKYLIEIDDEYNTISSEIYNINLIYPSYFGYNNNLLTGGEIISLGNQLLDNDNKRVIYNVNSEYDEYTYYSYPDIYDDLSNIILDDVTSILGAFKHIDDVDITNNYGVTVTNKVYVSYANGAFTNNKLEFI